MTGLGADDLWLAERGSRVIGLDYVTRASRKAAAVAAEKDLPLEFRHLNLCELRSVLAESARLAHEPGPKAVIARHIAEATDKVGRAHLWRACEMVLAGGGQLYLEFLVRKGEDDSYARKHHLRALPVSLVEEELAGRGATVVKKVKTDDPTGRRICRMVVSWHR